MQSQPSFNLDHAVAAWRDELARQPGLTPADLRELEAHLRDGFAELRKLGLRDDEAFLVACHRVGPPRPVAVEYAKAAPRRLWSPRVFWMAFGALLIQLWQATLGLWTSALLLNPSVAEHTVPDLSSVSSMSSSASTAYFGDIEVPGWVGCLVLALVYLLVCGVPVYFIGRRLACGKMESLAQLVSTRMGVAALGLVLFLSALSLQLLALYCWQTTRAENAFNGPTWGIEQGMTIGTWAIMQYNLFISSLWPLCLIALMIWLTPRRDKTKVKAHTVAA